MITDIHRGSAEVEPADGARVRLRPISPALTRDAGFDLRSEASAGVIHLTFEL